MESLPFHLLEEFLFKLDPKSLAMMQCADKSINSDVSNDPYFKPEYLSRLGSGLLHMSTFGSNSLFCHSSGSTRDNSKDRLEIMSYILGSCSGLLLLFIDGLCVANPLTKRFMFLSHSESKLPLDLKNRTGFTVDGITKRFKIVCLSEHKSSHTEETMYRFQINSGDSCWLLSESSITCRSSDLMRGMKPVNLNGSLHWLRNDGSIVAFNPETERARLIPTILPQGLSSKILFAAGNNELALVSTTEEAISVFTLEEILTDPKWVLVKRIGSLEDKERIDVVAYDGKCLVVREIKKESYNRLVHGYDVRANKWSAIGLIPGSCDSTHDFYQFKPSFSYVKELVNVMTMVRDYDDKRMSSLSKVMRLIDEKD